MSAPGRPNGMDPTDESGARTLHISAIGPWCVQPIPVYPPIFPTRQKTLSLTPPKAEHGRPLSMFSKKRGASKAGWEKSRRPAALPGIGTPDGIRQEASRCFETYCERWRSFNIVCRRAEGGRQSEGPLIGKYALPRMMSCLRSSNDFLICR